MKEDTRWKIIVGFILVTLSLALYTVHYFIFQDAHHLLIFLMEDIAFIPIEVLIVTLIIDQMLESREKQQRMEKLNMVIGTFFSSLGTQLLATLSRADPGVQAIRTGFPAGNKMDDQQFTSMKQRVSTYQCTIVASQIDLPALRELLVTNEDFLLRLVENPMVFEHESFTDLILAITHLTEELKAREDLTSLPPSDIAHLQGDMIRVYSQLVPAWMRYMEYLKATYPYLFSLAMRKNPFSLNTSAVVE